MQSIRRCGFIISIVLASTASAFARDGNPPVDLVYQKGEKVLVLWKRQWWQGEVKRVRKPRHSYRVHYTGWPTRWDEWLNEERLAKLCGQ